ncbi:hypothetical protein [Ornithinibacillus bavariensis]|uniref:DUF4829 domain-containing protein n=1 Tax=Ornithinibacillus bavariensis TaxID=545502 RepID=A0A919XAC5_9BACI|nr:hypothetical protein [Ornithinibacillus bavariensis]GIO27435.1 hypothetical protein J43TS3_20460 [Ornithinibacillus bavariensis]
MKRNIFIVGILIVLLSIMFYSQVGKTNNVQVSLEQSTKFSEEEINEAIVAVKKKFKEFRGCELTELWYSESSNGMKDENTMILLSNFKVNSSGGDGSFEPNSTQSDWNWILRRDSKNDNWRVDAWGY